LETKERVSGRLLVQFFAGRTINKSACGAKIIVIDLIVEWFNCSMVFLADNLIPLTI
jgi:hypothetical protein